MNKKTLVSCIVIFFNAGEKFFIEAIESVFAQTYNHWELLLADDGSSDKSTEIALQYAQQYPEKVRYVEHEGHQNRGMSATRNLGIHHARGEYIALLDADDIWLPQKLEKQVEILEAHPEAGMVYGSTLTWHSWTGNPEDVKRDSQRRLGVQPDILLQPPTLLRLFLQGKADTPGTCSVLIRRELIKKVGGFEESFRGMYEDQIFFYKFCLKIPIFIESGCWDKYRQHPNSTCSVSETLGIFNRSQPHSTHLIFLHWVEKYLEEQEVNDTKIWQGFNRAMFPYRHPNFYSFSQGVKKYIKRFIKLVVSYTFPDLMLSQLKAKLR